MNVQGFFAFTLVLVVFKELVYDLVLIVLIKRMSSVAVRESGMLIHALYLSILASVLIIIFCAISFRYLARI